MHKKHEEKHHEAHKKEKMHAKKNMAMPAKLGSKPLAKHHKAK